MVAEAKESEDAEEDDDEDGAGAAVVGVLLLDGAECESQCDGRCSGSSLSRDSRAWMIWGLDMPDKRRRCKRSICSMVYRGSTSQHSILATVYVMTRVNFASEPETGFFNEIQDQLGK